MARSILGTVGLAITLAFAIPVAYIGVEFLLDGRTNQGLLFLAIAALMIGVEEHLTTPTDIPGMVAERVLGSAVKEPEEGTDAGSTEDIESTVVEAGHDGSGPGAADPDAVAAPTNDGEGDDADVLIPDAEGDRPE